MDVTDDPQRWLDTLNMACRKGDELSALVCRQNNEIRMLRGVLWQALALLRTGRIDAARSVLEKKVVKRS